MCLRTASVEPLAGGVCRGWTGTNAARAGPGAAAAAWRAAQQGPDAWPAGRAAPPLPAAADTAASARG